MSAGSARAPIDRGSIPFGLGFVAELGRSWPEIATKPTTTIPGPVPAQ
jgi:hypothetical protein